MRAELIVPLNESGISKIFFKAEYLLYLLSGASGGQDCSEIQFSEQFAVLQDNSLFIQKEKQ